VKIAVLASGTGTNLQALIDQVHRRDDVTIVAVGSDKPEAVALQRAHAAGIPTRAFPAAQFAGGRLERDTVMAAWLTELGVELVVLAGFMQLISPGFLDAFPDRVINVHPALSPAFPGLDAVGQALEYGVKVFGVTVHFIDSGVDSGAIILQQAIHLPHASSREDVFTELRPLEHALLAEAVRRFAAGSVRRDAAQPRRIWVE
jgi:phosphoribosylglycinamide formyltransferase-1